MDNEVITIYADDIELAQNLCSPISDNNARNRAVANVLAVKLAERFFSSENIQADTKTGLHNIPNIIENIDIADIYINGAYVDVRVYFSDDELSIPKFHFDLGVNPAVYMFIQLKSDLSGYKVSGFIRPENINKDNLKDDYYYIDKDSLVSFYDIESLLTEVTDNFNGSKEMLYSFVDGTIDENNIAELIKTLISSANARIILMKAFKANSLFKFVSAVPQSQNIVNSEEMNNDEDSLFEVDENKSDKGISNSAEDDMLDGDSLYNALEYSTEVTPSTVIYDELTNNAHGGDDEKSNIEEEQIDSLFTGEQEGVPVNNKKRKSSSLRVSLLLIVLLAACGFFAYTKIVLNNSDNALQEDTLPVVEANQEDVAPVQQKTSKDVAMPDETVNDSASSPAVSEEATSVVIPAIEQHLDASVLVSNLKVDWEVPSGYASNTAAKRYLVKLGKVIQLNLKSELLLLTKPPISNKITVELKYDSSRGKFDVVGMNDSSGEKSVDEVIMTTIKNALNLDISSNIESFGKLQGNPVLVIHL